MTTASSKPGNGGGEMAGVLARLLFATVLALNWVSEGPLSDTRLPTVFPTETAKLEPAEPAMPFIAPHDGATLVLREEGGRGAEATSGDNAATLAAYAPPVFGRTAMPRLAAPAGGPAAVLPRLYDPRGPPATA